MGQMEQMTNNNTVIRRRNNNGKIEKIRIENGEKTNISESEEEIAQRMREEENKKIKTKLKSEIDGFLAQKKKEEKNYSATKETVSGKIDTLFNKK